MTITTGRLRHFSAWPRPALGLWLVGIALIALLLACQRGEPPAPAEQAKSEPVSPEAGKPRVAQPAEVDASVLVATLQKAGWDPSIARTVVELNRRWFHVLADENAAELERQLALLADLGRHPDVFPILREHPEVAGLLAGTVSVEEHGPEQVARSLGEGERYDLAARLYAVYLESESVLQVARVLETDGDLIADLTARQIPHPEILFLTLPADAEAAAVYHRWLREYLQEALGQDDEALLQCVTVVYEAGAAIRRRLEGSRQFRERFREELWPAFCRIVAETPDSALLYLCDPRIWDVLAGEHGESLLARWGLLAAELLDPANCPAELQANLIEAMLAGDNETVQAVMQFAQEPLFRELLRRPQLSAQVRATALRKLTQEGPNYPQLLRRYQGLSAAALADEVGPPPDGPVTWIPLYYTVYEVPKKLLQGREPSGMDVFLAILDPVLLATGPLGPKDVVKTGLRQAAKTTGTQAVKQAAASAARSQVVRALGEGGGRIAAEWTERELMPWMFKHLLREVRAVLAKTAEQIGTVEITGLVRSLFTISGLKRDAFRRLTSLEARLFMRPDARVFLRFDRLVRGNHFLARFLEETAAEGGINLALESEPGQQLVRDGMQLAVQGEQAAADRLQAWRQHIAAVWLSAHTGLLDRLAPSP